MPDEKPKVYLYSVEGRPATTKSTSITLLHARPFEECEALLTELTETAKRFHRVGKTLINLDQLLDVRIVEYMDFVHDREWGPMRQHAFYYAEDDN